MSEKSLIDEIEPETVPKQDEIRILGRRHILRQKAFDVAQYMKTWSDYLGWPVLQRFNGYDPMLPSRVDNLTFRIERGQYTGYTYNDLEDAIGGQIICGVKRIEDHLTGNHHRYWSFRDISERGYIEGRTSVAHALVHLVIHEFAHVLQVEKCTATPETAHNAAFYQELDDLYQEAFWEETLQPLFEAIYVRVNSPFKPRVRTRPFSPARLDTVNYVLADYAAGERRIARLDRINQKTCTVTWPHGDQERVDKEFIDSIRMWGIHAV